jgi:hypothetical protein
MKCKDCKIKEWDDAKGWACVVRGEDYDPEADACDVVMGTRGKPDADARALARKRRMSVEAQLEADAEAARIG